MPPFAGLSDTQVWQLVAYLRSLQPAAAELRLLRPAPAAQGHAAAGETLFSGPAALRELSRGQRPRRDCRAGPVERGTTLACGAAAEDRQSEQPSPRHRRARGGRGGLTPATVIVKTLDGREIRGVRRNEDTFSLQMIDMAGQLRMFDKLQLSSVVVDNTSLHPPDYATRLSAGEIANLVAYLAHASGTRPEQDRVRAAGSRRCDLRARSAPRQPSLTTG